MGLYYLPFWLEYWWKDYKVQSLPRNIRLIFYDFLFLLWDRDMRLQNDDHAISYYMRITPEEWVDAKRTLINSNLIQCVSGGKMLTCHRLGEEFERISERSTSDRNKAVNAARSRWQKT